MKILLAHGADMDAVTLIIGVTALMEATARGHNDILEQLITAGRK